MKKFITITIMVLLIVSFMSISVSAKDTVLSNKGIQNNDAGVADDFEVSPNQVVNTPTTDGLVADDFELPIGSDGVVADDFEVSPDSKVITPITNQGINTDTSQQIHSAVEFNTDATFREKEVLDPNKIYIKTNKEVAPKIQSAIYDLRVKPSKIFSPVLSSVENLVVNPAIENEKVIYRLTAKNVNKPIFSDKEVLEPIFDLRVNQPVEFRLVDNRIIVNDEQIIDYKKIVREKEVMPPIEIEIHSAITDGKVYDLKIVPSPESAEFRFIYREKEVMMPIYSDFKVKDKKLYLLENNKSYDLRINPPEIYSVIYNLRVEEPKIVIKELSLGIENEKAVYNLRVKEPAKILWIIPWTVESKYLIDPADGSAKLTDSPWYITSEKLGDSYEWDFDNDVPYEWD